MRERGGDIIWSSCAPGVCMQSQCQINYKLAHKRKELVYASATCH